ncbi:MAG: RagB/SusD family nutrient uptake outer membrane protein [Parabacteroides sp.]|nr:RagB/SusD family nutrient uptake outer membrane protein [Parabacteroides sp.]
MKKLNIIIYMLVATLCSSCLDDFLTIKPLATITNEVYWQSESDARSELNAAYAHLQSAYKTGFLYWTEARGDNFLGNVTGSKPVQNVTFNKINATHNSANWNDWYKMISVANYGIHFIPTMTGKLEETTQNHLLSEAYFLRAFAYFNLYRIWGDVPLITEPVLKKSEVTKPCVTGKDTVFACVVSDLEKAVKLVDVTVDNIFIYSPGALYALCTDVAMWAKDYEKAVEYSQMLYDLKKYTLNGVDFADVCAVATTTDNIWTLKWSYSVNGENTITSTLGNSSNPLIPNKLIYDKWSAWEKEAGALDARRAATIDSIKYKSYTSKHANRLPAGCQTWKWSPGKHLAQSEYQECYIPIYRLADIILLRAEALNKLGRMNEAIAEMNKIRVRAGLPGKDLAYYGGDSEKLDSDIFQERQFELFAEGKRWFDLMRTDRVESVMNDYFENYIAKYGGTGYRLFMEEWMHYWPIHTDILNENENLHQIGEY